VLDGANTMSLLEMGDSMRVFQKQQKEVGEGPMAQGAAAMPELEQTKEAGTLRNPGKDVFVKGRSGEWTAAKDGRVILPGDEVKTSPGSSVEVMLSGGKVGRVEIQGGSLFRIDKAGTDVATGDKTTVLGLALGKILVEAKSLTGNSKFEVRTPTAITGARGTVFEVTVKEKA
jgi:hypothetical protein